MSAKLSNQFLQDRLQESSRNALAKQSALADEIFRLRLDIKTTEEKLRAVESDLTFTLVILVFAVVVLVGALLL